MYDSLYTCLAFEKQSANQTQRLDMMQSFTEGGFYSFSMKINFLHAEVTLNKNTIENIDYPMMRFAYRSDVNDYILYVYEYTKAYFIIEKGNKKEPHVTMRLENRDLMHYTCMMYIDANNTNQ